ncbi:DMT family transporter [Methylobacterium oryzihabitans]|uniref:DMT family transporter n=1 Tax=Methylobacterium oryzihabitans TaxID=2499852 RepID=A0A3S2VKS5_9HYPH|nr:DMT family transporter [Methylobacterium oryzihabitans]RVU15187.1 DMT family transporter [Methylobacterium oryzihabitans]
MSGLDGDRRRQVLVGIALMIGAVAGFACIDATAKALNRSLNPLLVVAARYVGSFVLVALVLGPRRGSIGLLRSRRPALQVFRSLCLVIATVCSFFALRSLPLAQVTSITFASPLIVALIAGPLLGEHIGWRRLAAVLAGFAGVLVVARPGLGMPPAALLAVVTAAVNGIYIVATRMLAAHDPPETTMLYTGLVGAVVTAPALVLLWESPPDLATWTGLFAIGGFGTLGHWLLILAHRHAPASTLAPFGYAHLLWALLIGFAAFGDVPDRWTLLGGAVVAAAGLFLIAEERRPAATGRNP